MYRFTEYQLPVPVVTVYIVPKLIIKKSTFSLWKEVKPHCMGGDRLVSSRHPASFTKEVHSLTLIMITLQEESGPILEVLQYQADP